MLLKLKCPSFSRHTQQTRDFVLCASQASRTCFSSCDFVSHPHPRGCSPSQSLSHLQRGQQERGEVLRSSSSAAFVEIAHPN